MAFFVLLAVIRAGGPEFLKTDPTDGEDRLVVTKVGKGSEMGIDPLSNIVLDVSIGIEGEPIVEDKKRHILHQHPLVDPKSSQLILGHNLRILNSPVVQDELAGAFHRIRLHGVADILQEPA